MKRLGAGALVMMMLVGALGAAPDGPPPDDGPSARANAPLPATVAPGPLTVNVRETIQRTGPTLALFALASLVPAALLMVTAFVRVHVVLVLLRQALGSPQVPGNQVLSALALLLAVLVMKPVGTSVYERAIAPYAAGTLEARAAWEAGTRPLKVFMVDQIVKARHQSYLWTLWDHAGGPGPSQSETVQPEDVPLLVVAPAFLLSELTTALVMGFAIALPFLVIDLVVAAILGAMGLFTLPPTIVAVPIKLILFVLADGWALVADVLLRSFA